MSAYYYAIPGEVNYALYMAMADRGALHLEARYQYEDFDTVSLWGGWNFGFGDDLRLDATLMGGVVAGTSQGVAPGFRFNLEYGAFYASSETEYFVSTEDQTENYYYNWSEFGVSPWDWLSAGVSTQRTLVIETDGVVEPGLFAAVNVLGVNLSFYAFGADSADRYYIVGLAFAF